MLQTQINLQLCVPKIWLLGLTSTWAHNLFVFVGFGFPTMGDPMLGNLSTLLFPPTLLFTSLSHYLTFSNGCSFLLLFSPELPTLIPHYLPLFIGQDEWRCHDYFPSLVWMGIQFHHLKVDAQSGKVEVALELIPTFKSLLDSDVLKGITR